MKIPLITILCLVCVAADSPPIPKSQPVVRRGAALAAAIPESSLVPLVLSWEYPKEELSSDLTFRVYHTTNIASSPIGWELKASVPGTNTSTTISVAPGVHYFAVKTFSTFWGSESSFSDAVATPAAPKQGSNLSISR